MSLGNSLESLENLIIYSHGFILLGIPVMCDTHFG